MVGHLAELGWRDIVQFDKGPLPNPGGSTGHASNFIFPVDHNREMAALTLDSQRQYAAMGVNTTCGGIEIARKPERMEEFRRRMTSAKAWGVDAELVTPAEIAKLVPFVNTDIVLGGFYTPSVSVVDSLRGRHDLPRAGDRARRAADGRQHRGARHRGRRRRACIGRRDRPGAHRGRVRRRSRAACGARASRRWPARPSRSRPPCTR